MSRYLGRKPVNWPANTLVFGWIALSFPLFFFNDDVSQFPRLFETGPLIWWPEMDFIGFVLVMSPMAYGSFALWLMPKVDWSPKAGVILTTLGALSFVGGVAWCAWSGCAVFPDRIVYREPGIAKPVKIEWFSDIRRVEVSCIMVRERRGSRRTPEAIYDLVFASGYRVNVWSTPASGRGDDANVLGRIRLIAQAADAVHALHGPRRHPDGTPYGDAGCVDRLAQRYGVERNVVTSLLAVHQSELKPEEYTLVPPAP